MVHLCSEEEEAKIHGTAMDEARGLGLAPEDLDEMVAVTLERNGNTFTDLALAKWQLPEFVRGAKGEYDGKADAWARGWNWFNEHRRGKVERKDEGT